MQRRILICLPLAATFLGAQQTEPTARPGAPPEDVKLPNGKSQREEMLKAEYQRSLEDSAALVKAAEDLKIELEKNDSHVLSVSALKQLDTIEKLSKRIRGRIRRF
jgi:hypothetical protein